ncbi:hypothetical protein D3C80_709430 [compost metagenome]
MRLRTVTTTPVYANSCTVYRCHRGAGHKTKFSCGHTRPVTQPINGIARKALKEAVFDHASGTCPDLLSRLENEMHSAGKTTGLGEIASRCQQNGRMSVMATCVHHTGITACIIEPGILDDRQGVHVRPDADGLAGVATLQCANDARTANAGCNVVAPLTEMVRHQSRGPCLLERQLRMGMNVATQSDKLVDKRGKTCLDFQFPVCIWRPLNIHAAPFR